MFMTHICKYLEEDQLSGRTGVWDNSIQRKRVLEGLLIYAHLLCLTYSAVPLRFQSAVEDT